MVRKNSYNRKMKEKGNFLSQKDIRWKLYSSVNLLMKLKINAQDFMTTIYHPIMTRINHL